MSCGPMGRTELAQGGPTISMSWTSKGPQETIPTLHAIISDPPWMGDGTRPVMREGFRRRRIAEVASASTGGWELDGAPSL